VESIGNFELRSMAADIDVACAVEAGPRTGARPGSRAAVDERHLASPGRLAVISRSTDKLIALQFLAVVLPIALVLLLQMIADAQRAAALAHSRPLRALAADARANYKTFTNGAADVIDTGTLGSNAADALRTAAARLRDLENRGENAVIGEAPAVVDRLARTIAPGAPLNVLLARRAEIMRGDELTKAIDAEFERQDEAVVKDAIDSSIRQKHRVVGALLASTALTVLFVLATRRRLKRRLETEAAVERKRRAELETVSVRFGIATQAARAGVYEWREHGEDVWWNETMCELYGQSVSSFKPSLSEWLHLIHPDDRVGAKATLTAAMREQGQLRSHYRIVRPDGSVRHVESLGTVVRDSIGAGWRLIGIDFDVTERVMAEQRERQLQLQLRDASRNAGMAEVATNVLHNVGNVLNSVNVSASLVTDIVRRSRAAGLARVADLVKEHAADLGTFVSTDDRGKHLPYYLEQLSKALLTEQTGTLGELDSLAKNIQHIKQIVAMQQSYAKLAGVTDTLDLKTLVDDCLRISAAADAAGGVSVQRESENVPPIVVDKHKVLQILVNLLRNARHACEASGRSDKLIIVKVTNRIGGVRIEVKDNGVGIPVEHMTRIFSHGFTTKKEGHGFGLHGGALAARELGGALHAASDGPGTGATFTIDLPLQPPETHHG
jgi:PAS domain S-box-containing protein